MQNASQLREALLEKSWIGFDLDDTLHEFRRASSGATTKVLEQISEQYGTPFPALRQEYGQILRRKTASAFSDGKTSHEYRRERFSLLLGKFFLPLDELFLRQLLEVYETTLVAMLALKAGVLGTLSVLRKLGKKIVIITEGPQDAQERTIEALGISDSVDFLATTNHFQVSKVDGLFSKVLEHLGISAGEMAYVGDSEERDIQPAVAAGILSIHLCEESEARLSLTQPRIGFLTELQQLLERGRDVG